MNSKVNLKQRSIWESVGLVVSMSVGILGGGATGALVGAIAGPIGLIAGGMTGALAGALAGEAFMDAMDTLYR